MQSTEWTWAHTFFALFMLCNVLGVIYQKLQEYRYRKQVSKMTVEEFRQLIRNKVDQEVASRAAQN